jgi:uncharacterized membrane protein
MLMGLFVCGAKQAKADLLFTTLNGVEADGINNSGDIVGGYTIGSYLYRGGSYTPIHDPSSLVTVSRGINNADQIVGYYNDANGLHGFLMSGGSYTSLDVPGAVRTFAYGINNAAQIVGSYQIGSDTGPQVGFLLNGGVFTTIGLPTTRVHAINDLGQILTENLLLSEGNSTPIHYPRSLLTVAWGINNFGDIVGTYDDQTAEHAFLLKDGVYSSIDFPGATDTGVLGINDADQVVGFYVDPAGNQHAFLATPVSEPCTLWALILGMVCTLCWARYRKARGKSGTGTFPSPSRPVPDVRAGPGLLQC